MEAERADEPLQGSRLAAFAALIAAVQALAAFAWFPDRYADSSAYMDLARGLIAQVHRPFANRILHPLVVRAVSQIAHTSLSVAFFVVGVLSTAVIAHGVVALGPPAVRRPRVAALLLLNPVMFSWLVFSAHADGFHAACVALLALALRARRHFLTALWMGALMVTRESSLVLFVVLAVAYAQAKDRPTVATLGVGATAGFAVARALTRNALPNIHGMNELAYLLAKVPFNGLRNLFGVAIWTPTFAWTCDRTLMAFDLAGRSLAICRPIVEFPLHTLLCMTTVFGLLPTIGLFLLRRRLTIGAHSRQAPLAPWVRGLAAYGVISWVASPLLGVWTDHLMAAAWPVMWIAIPLLGADLAASASPRALCTLLGCSLAVGWIGWQLASAQPTIVALPLGARALVVALALTSHGIAWVALTRHDRDG